MTIPTASNYPTSFDTDDNLFLVHDSLRVRLLEDYNPGDTSVLVEGDAEIMGRFPATGIITLTEQCSDIDKRALSFYYGSKTSVSFDDLELLPEFSDLDSVKPKRITNVTMNVLDKHHNHLKDTLIAAEKFLGTKYAKDKTITGRINYLEKTVFTPKAWFSVDKQVGLGGAQGLTVNFVNQSTRLGPGKVTETWSFGEDNVSDVVVISQDQQEYLTKEDVVGGVVVKGTTFTKTYFSPGVYTVKLTVSNENGQDEVEFKNLINVRTECPEPANIQIIQRPSQNYTNGNPPKIRSIANSFVDLEIPEEEDPSRPGYSYAGELLGGLPGDPVRCGGRPIDCITEYTWNLKDDLPHGNSNSTKASYSLGGIYDIVLRVDTEYGAYRITKYEGSIDIVESTNLWMFNYSTSNPDGSGILRAYEFGLDSETFKTLGNQTLTLTRSNGFLSQSPLSYGSGGYYGDTLSRAKKEFRNNVEFVPVGSVSSGNRGNSLLFWAEGGSVTDSKEVKVKKYNAFDDTYASSPTIPGRPWNWAALCSADNVYFLFGQNDTIVPNQNPAWPKRLDYSISTESFGSDITLTSSSFDNGADSLLEHPSVYNGSGLATNGYFASYRTAWKDSTGYILRNSSVNEFFRLASFYKTKGSVSQPFSVITRLPDMIGSVKTEAQMVTLVNGVFVFNNSGEICAWNDTSLVWEVGQASSSSLNFRSVQDTSTSGFDDRSNTLLAASDKDRMAYLSYDYSEKAFVKFNGTDLTFSTTKYRPPGKQFKMGVY